jgi:pimeloyl-ACP methyl ester carboxylesterase
MDGDGVMCGRAARHRGRSWLLSAAALLSLAAAPAPEGSEPAGREAYDPEATSVAYAYPVRFFEFESQRERLRMAYLDVAPQRPNGRAVLLLHGKNFHAGTWATTIASLQRAGFRVVAPDQIGFGKSSKPERYQFTFLQLAANTRALLASLGIERSVVVGHSMGGMLAARYAIAYPAATERLVLVNPIGLEDYAAMIPPQTVDDWYRQELAQTPEKVREYQRTSYYGGEWKAEYREHTRLLEGWTRHPDYWRVAWDSALTYDMILSQPVLPDLHRVSVPTRLIIGTRDRTALGRPLASPEVQKRMGDYTTLGKRAQQRIPGAELVEIPGVGHVPQVEAFQPFERALLEFLH